MCICRIVVTDDLMRAVVNNSAAVYDYMVDLDLSLSLVKKKKNLSNTHLWIVHLDVFKF